MKLFIASVTRFYVNNDIDARIYIYLLVHLYMIWKNHYFYLF